MTLGPGGYLLTSSFTVMNILEGPLLVECRYTRASAVGEVPVGQPAAVMLATDPSNLPVMTAAVSMQAAASFDAQVQVALKCRLVTSQSPQNVFARYVSMNAVKVGAVHDVGP